MRQINKFQSGPNKDNSFMGQLAPALPLIGAAAGSVVPGVGTAAGMGLGMGVGSAAQGLLTPKPQAQAEQPQQGVGGGGAMENRLAQLRQNTDGKLQQLRQAALALPSLPPDLRQEATQPIMTALIQDAYGRPMKG